jgi:hypothetical protein
VLALELGPCTAAMPHQSARMVITTMRRTPALLTASTARVGSLVEYSSGLDPGTTAMAAIGAVAVITAAAVTTVAVVTTDEAGTIAAVATTDVVAMQVADRSLPRTEISQAMGLREARWAVDSTAGQLADPMALAGSMAAVVADPTEVAEAMAAVDTGN